jgi:uncharacterized protein GlcG (DUF336 family)
MLLLDQVLDQSGNLRVFYRMDGARAGDRDVAVRKARTAVLFEQTSDTIGQQARPGNPLYSM